MLALAAWEDSRCRQCGGDLHETTHPANEDGYAALPPTRCHRCTALARSEEKYRGTGGKGQAQTPHPHALIHRVELKPGRHRHTWTN